MASEKKQAKKRYREFYSCLYLESCKEDWKKQLEDLCIPVFISPYHDSDVEETGEIKKPHYHIMIMFTAPHPIEDAKSIFESIGSVGCDVVKSHRGYARYLCHLDSPHKAPYSPEDVISLGGADYFTAISLPSDRYAVIKDMIQFVNDNDVKAYSDLVEYALNYEPNWFRSLCDNSTFVIKEYIKSRYWAITVLTENN